jgi:hypothetical protein
MDWWKPGTHPQPWNWKDEIASLRERGELYSLKVEAGRDGRHVAQPVLLGGDGRVWDGTDRVIYAYMKGVVTIPVIFGFVRSRNDVPSDHGATDPMA